MQRCTSITLHMPRKLVVRSVAALVFSMSVAHAAETQFYSNANLGSPGYPTYYGAGSTEFADDVPFSGTHLVSSFTVGYQSSQPVHATFRFYGVDPATELPGALVAQIEREFPAGESTPTITLSEAEQFLWIAEPYLYPGEFNGSIYTGGWFSVQYSTDTGELPEARFRLASGAGTSGLLYVEKGVIFSTLDPSGTLPSSMYLKLLDTESSGVVQPTVAKMTVSPSTVKGGTSVVAAPFLTSQAPEGGTVVTLTSSNPMAASVPSQVVVPAGATNITVNVQTYRRGKKTQTVTLTAEANGSTASTTLTITP